MKRTLLVVPFLFLAGSALAQVTPAAGYTPPDDTPQFNIGATVTSAVLVDYDSLERTGITPSAPRTTNYGVKMLINF